MQTLKLSGLIDVKVSLLEGAEKFQLTLQFGANKPPTSIDIELDNIGLAAIAEAVRRFQTRHKIPIPPSLRPRGIPTLKIVRED